jgi:hypothetical protein
MIEHIYQENDKMNNLETENEGLESMLNQVRDKILNKQKGYIEELEGMAGEKYDLSMQVEKSREHTSHYLKNIE